MNHSAHAQIRAQQRGIPPLVIDLLLSFGRTESVGGGTSKVYLDKAARRRIKAYAGPLARALDEHLDLYAVIGRDNTVITVGHRYERIQRS